MFKFFAPFLLVGCVTAETYQDLAVIKKVVSCDADTEFNLAWCVVSLEDGRLAVVPTWDIKEGDKVVCEQRGSLTCLKR